MDLPAISRRLRRDLAPLRFAAPVAQVYRPLDYAWEPHLEYLQRYGAGAKRVVLVGMNPGPWGMAQTGVPFGTVSMVRDWMGLEHRQVGHPPAEHPKRPVQGFDCTREEVSGARLWGWARDRWGSAVRFFEHFWVTNYCPLLFLDAAGRNLTPDRLKAKERHKFTDPCDRALRCVVEVVAARSVIGVGTYAEKRIEEACADLSVATGCILHPSPASPAANRDWAGTVSEQLHELGIEVP